MKRNYSGPYSIDSSNKDISPSETKFMTYAAIFSSIYRLNCYGAWPNPGPFFRDLLNEVRLDFFPS